MEMRDVAIVDDKGLQLGKEEEEGTIGVEGSGSRIKGFGWGGSWKRKKVATTGWGAGKKIRAVTGGPVT
ncbi:hypothetical protein GW17_00012627 [Ensete ventricosum]|nr:hypothetical protein GW17_00012627 [Ensete ventricosum]RZS12346.1 hypothetical protein BHM03_00043764 [Ensete ventricosum]